MYLSQQTLPRHSSAAEPLVALELQRHHHHDHHQTTLAAA
jgi:hypothetical protein